MLNSNTCGTYAGFRNSLVHEMVHYYVSCYTQLPDKNWELAEECADKRDKKGMDVALRKTQETCHQYEWKRIADELSTKYPELGGITEYVDTNSETGFVDRDYIIRWATNNVILKREYYDDTVLYYIISAKSRDWLLLRDALATGKSTRRRFAGTWTRLFCTLDPAKFRARPVLRDMTNSYRSLPEGMIRSERELGHVIYDFIHDETINSKSGLSSEEIDKICDSVRVFCKNKKTIYFVKRDSKACNILLDAIEDKKHGAPLKKNNEPSKELCGRWEELEINRNPRYFVKFKIMRNDFTKGANVKYYENQKKFILGRKYIGTIDTYAVMNKETGEVTFVKIKDYD